VSLINSHMINCEYMFFVDKDPVSETPYIVTMHGSYDIDYIRDDALLFKTLKTVTHWIYTAEKNLNVFKGIPLASSAFTKIPNAMPYDERPFPQSRKDLGIAEDALVYTLVARGIKRKGWWASASAFARLVEEDPSFDAHLILVGTGPQADRAHADFGTHDAITFLGYQPFINGLYRISDCALLPTRFEGESFPLCLIQALQEGTPVIATDVGEIRGMITRGRISAGILLEYDQNSERFRERLLVAMKAMRDDKTRQEYAKNAKTLAEAFDLPALQSAYRTVFDSAMANSAS
jgi:glycosyltransferase involved in cell wall biosynthesis